MIENNSAGAGGIGGGIAAQILETPEAGTAGVFLERVRLTDNQAAIASALSVEEAPFEIGNSLISGNLGPSGSAILATDFSAGSALSPGTVLNSTLIGAGSGSAIETDSPLEMINSIVTKHSVGVFYSGPEGGLVLRHNDFFANPTDVSAGAAFALDPSNLRVDPMLDGSARLLPGSPLIDAGMRAKGPFTDLDGEPRPAAGPSGRFAFDIGADEAPGEAQRVFEVDRGGFDFAWVGPGASPAEAIGHALLGADWSGDGIDDLLVAARDWGRGLGWLGPGERVFGAFDAWLGAPPALELLADPGANLRSLASGSLRGDGAPDLALGSDSGVFVIRADPGLAGPLDLAQRSVLRVIAPEPGGSFAPRGALAIGDVSGDGIGDLLIGDPGALQNRGAVHAIFGSPALDGVRELASIPAELTILGSAAGDAFGLALALADLDGDGALDLAIADATRTHVLLGPLALGVRPLASAPADARVENLGGAPLAALDLTGEGRADLVGGGTPLRVVAGPFRADQVLDANQAASLVLTSEGTPESLHAADLIGDARPELLVGLPGSAYAISSGVRASGVLPIDQLASLALADGAPASRLGADVASADLDADGRADWLVSDPAAGPLEPHPPGAGDAGRVYAIYGGKPADNCPGLANPTQLDSDGDGAGDACDACPSTADPAQRDLGGTASPADPPGELSDGIGDACQCGDATGDGHANAEDLAALRSALAGKSALAVPERCNVRGPISATSDPRTGLRADCNLIDAVVLARQLAGQPPSVAQVCAPAAPLH